MKPDIKTFEDLACYWFIVHGVTHKTASSLKRDQGILKNYIFPAFGNSPLEELAIHEIDEWFSRLKQNSRLAAKSCNDVLGLFRKILNDAVRWGFIERNPADRVQKLKVADRDYVFWCPEEAKQYLGYWQSREVMNRVVWASFVALYTGLRRGEVIALKWNSFDKDSNMLTIKSTYCRIQKKVKHETKSKKIRHVPVCKALNKILDELKDKTFSSGFVCPFFHPDLYNKDFRRASTLAGVKEIRFQDLRHTFASNFLMGGGNIYDLQKILGHSTIQMTERYLHLVPSHLKGKTEVLGF